MTDGIVESVVVPVVAPVEHAVEGVHEETVNDIGSVKDHLRLHADAMHASRESMERVEGHLASIANQLVEVSANIATAATNVAGHGAETVLEVPQAAAQVADEVVAVPTEVAEQVVKRGKKFGVRKSG